MGMVVVALFAAVLDSHPAYPDVPERADDVAMAMIFSFREATQIHLLAHALGTAALNGTPSKEVIEHCDRAIDSYEAISIPMLSKYLGNVTHDKPTRETFQQVQVLQKRALAEVKAIKAMAESGNAQAERLAFVAANRAYTEVAQEVAEMLVNGPKRGDGRSAPAPSEDDPDETLLAKSPNRRLFSDEEWSAIVAEIMKQGLVQKPSDADRFVGTFGLLKNVFVQKRIPEPSVKQLFGLAKVLNLPFHQAPADKIETALASMLQLAKEAQTEVATRETLMSLGDE
jgi:hypothetical protein